MTSAGDPRDELGVGDPLALLVEVHEALAAAPPRVAGRAQVRAPQALRTAGGGGSDGGGHGDERLTRTRCAARG